MADKKNWHPLPRGKHQYGLKYSGFFFTINSNQSDKITKISEAFKKKFKTIVNVINNNIEEFIEDRKNPGSLSNILRIVKMDVKPEIGDSREFLHAHFYFKIEHKGNLTIVHKKITNFLNEALPGSYCSKIRGIPEQGFSIESYSSKGTE